MYFAIGWPKILDTLGFGEQIIRKICCDRVKILTAILTDDTLAIWYTKVSHRTVALFFCLHRNFINTIFPALCADCVIQTNVSINRKIRSKCTGRMEARLEYVGGCCKNIARIFPIIFTIIY